jgi:signal peptidase I
LHGVIRVSQVLFFCHLFWDHFYSVGSAIGASMLPTINIDGDFIVVSKLYARGRGCKVGDIISYVHPIRGPGDYISKRVIGMPGDFVVMNPLAVPEDIIQVWSTIWAEMMGYLIERVIIRCPTAIVGLLAITYLIRVTQDTTALFRSLLSVGRSLRECGRSRSSLKILCSPLQTDQKSRSQYRYRFAWVSGGVGSFSELVGLPVSRDFHFLLNTITYSQS